MFPLFKFGPKIVEAHSENVHITNILLTKPVKQVENSEEKVSASSRTQCSRCNGIRHWHKLHELLGGGQCHQLHG